MISAVFVIGMIYFYYMTDKNEIVNVYKEMLSPELQKRYEKITKEKIMAKNKLYVNIRIFMFIIKKIKFNYLTYQSI